MAPQTVTFLSKFSEYLLIRQPKIEVPLLTGGSVTQQQRLAYPFQPYRDPETKQLVGRLIVKEGQDKLDTDPEGWLRPGEAPGETRDAVAALMAHRSFGQDFWLSGHAPGTIYPRPVDMRRDIRLAGVNLDEEKLIEMIAEERRTHGRAELIEDAEGTLVAVREALAQAQVAADMKAAEEAKAAKAKPKAPAAT